MGLILVVAMMTLSSAVPYEAAAEEEQLAVLEKMSQGGRGGRGGRSRGSRGGKGGRGSGGGRKHGRPTEQGDSLADLLAIMEEDPDNDRVKAEFNLWKLTKNAWKKYGGHVKKYVGDTAKKLAGDYLKKHGMGELGESLTGNNHDDGDGDGDGDDTTNAGQATIEQLLTLLQDDGDDDNLADIGSYTTATATGKLAELQLLGKTYGSVGNRIGNIGRRLKTGVREFTDKVRNLVKKFRGSPSGPGGPPPSSSSSPPPSDEPTSPSSSDSGTDENHSTADDGNNGLATVEDLFALVQDGGDDDFNDLADTEKLAELQLLRGMIRRKVKKGLGKLRRRLRGRGHGGQRGSQGSPPSSSSSPPPAAEEPSSDDNTNDNESDADDSNDSIEEILALLQRQSLQ